MKVEFPYGRSILSGEIPEERFLGVIESELRDYVPDKTEEELVRNAMAEPCGTKRLSELSVGKRQIVIICSDHTRPVPSRIIIPEMLSEIRKGNPDAEVTLLIATGCHRETRKEELLQKFDMLPFR